jgi:hypothetical protein
MAISYSQITDLMSAATTALAAGNYASARDNAIAAQGLLSVLPDTERKSGDGGQQSLTWDRRAIDEFVIRCQRLVNAKLGVQVSEVQINNVGEVGE